MGTLNFGGMLASKTKQKQTTGKKGGGGADVNSLHLLIVKVWSYTLSDNCLNNNSLNDTQTTLRKDKSINFLQHTNLMITTYTAI